MFQGSGDLIMSHKIPISILFTALAAAILVYLLPANPGTTPLAPRTPAPAVAAAVYRFAVIGDYGSDSADEARVAALVAGWNPDFVITTGDNNYPDGAAGTIDRNIGKHYSSFIGNYSGQYGSGSPINRFWPSPGNHDWYSITCSAAGCNGPYLDYFTLPGNERYYDVDYGLVHLYALDSYGQEPDGVTTGSTQASRLQGELADSSACFDVVYFHHPPYSSGKHGSVEEMRWPFADWGADLVLSGHEHSYERLDVAGMPYIVNGIGGKSLYDFDHVGDLPAGVTSVVRYNDNYGAMLITVTATTLTSQLFDYYGVLIDEYVIESDCEDSPTATATPTVTPTSEISPTVTPATTPATAVPTPGIGRSVYLPSIAGNH